MTRQGGLSRSYGNSFIWGILCCKFFFFLFFTFLHIKKHRKWKKHHQRLNENRIFRGRRVEAPQNARKERRDDPSFALDQSEDGWFIASSANSLFTILAVNKALKKVFGWKKFTGVVKNNKQRGGTREAPFCIVHIPGRFMPERTFFFFFL